MTVHHCLKVVISLICFYSGIATLFHFLFPRRGLLILAYHRISDLLFDPLRLAISPRDFGIHMSYLNRAFHPLSLSAALAKLKSGITPKNLVVISFDDGYADNYGKAYPILQAHGFPAIIFLTVGPIEKKSDLWFDRVSSSVRSTRVKSIDMTKFGLGNFSLAGQRNKGRFVEAMIAAIKSNHSHEKEEIISFLEEALGKSGKPLMLSWEQIKTMRKNGIEFGCHTFSHPILTDLTPEDMRTEIAESQKVIEQRIGEPVRYFAYPNGDAKSYNEIVIDLLKEHDFQAAVSMKAGINTGHDWHSLKRLGIDYGFTGYKGFLTKAVFACEMAGLFDILFFRFLRQSA
jgi:peptidoglycan/xylan/chitin deacetylase (PgdA/CDA1 family)